MVSLAARSPDGLRIDLSPAGKVQVFLGDLAVAEGEPTVADAAGDLGQTSGSLGALQATEVARESDTRGKITRRFQNAVAEIILDVAGEDLTFTVTLANRYPFGGPSLRYARFTGLTVRFSRPADGTLGHWHVSYLAHVGPAIMHPSVQSQVGAWTARDDAFGVGIHLPSHTRRRKFAHADYDHAHQNAIPPVCKLGVYTDDITAPQAASQQIVSLRFSRDTSWQHLLEPYRAELAHEPMAYEPDNRPVVQFASVDAVHVTPMNPYGFNGEPRRLDTLDGVDKFLKWVADPLAAAGGLGCVFWALQGANPRGAMYRPDFDIFPPEVERLLPALVKGFRARGLRVGLCTRPGEIVERTNWKQDSTTRITATWQPGIDRMISRFKAVIDRGFDMFYLDSFGNSFDDYLIMQQLRAALGPKILCWAEHGCEIMLPLCGRYSEWSGGDLTLHSHYTAAIYRWLFPDSSYLVIDRPTATRGPLSAQDYGSHRYTPLIQDYQTTENAPLMNALRTNYLAGGAWKSGMAATQPATF